MIRVYTILYVEKSLDKKFFVKIKGAAPIGVESETKAEYVKAALAGRKASRGEKIQILNPARRCACEGGAGAAQGRCAGGAGD